MLVQMIKKEKLKVLRRSLESWELFGGKIGGRRAPPMVVRLLVVHTQVVVHLIVVHAPLRY